MRNKYSIWFPEEAAEQSGGESSAVSKQLYVHAWLHADTHSVEHQWLHAESNPTRSLFFSHCAAAAAHSRAKRIVYAFAIEFKGPSTWLSAPSGTVETKNVTKNTDGRVYACYCFLLIVLFLFDCLLIFVCGWAFLEKCIIGLKLF